MYIIYTTFENDLTACTFVKRKENGCEELLIAISSVIMRIYESAFQLKLLSYLDPRLTNAQHGHRPRRSITTNLMNLSIAVYDAFLKQRQLDTFYGDFQNAFDKL